MRWPDDYVEPISSGDGICSVLTGVNIYFGYQIDRAHNSVQTAFVDIICTIMLFYRAFNLAMEPTLETKLCEMGPHLSFLYVVSFCLTCTLSIIKFLSLYHVSYSWSCSLHLPIDCQNSVDLKTDLQYHPCGSPLQIWFMSLLRLSVLNQCSIYYVHVFPQGLTGPEIKGYK